MFDSSKSQPTNQLILGSLMYTQTTSYDNLRCMHTN